MTKLHKELENLSEEQRELFEMLLEKEGIQFGSTGRINLEQFLWEPTGLNN